MGAEPAHGILPAHGRRHGADPLRGTRLLHDVRPLQAHHPRNADPVADHAASGGEHERVQSCGLAPGLCQPHGPLSSRSACCGPQLPGTYSTGGAPGFSTLSTMAHAASTSSSRAKCAVSPISAALMSTSYASMSSPCCCATNSSTGRPVMAGPGFLVWAPSAIATSGPTRKRRWLGCSGPRSPNTLTGGGP